jgi:hypothetical protein
MMMNVEQLAELKLSGKTEEPGEELPQCHFVHHKSHITWHCHEPRKPRWKADD